MLALSGLTVRMGKQTIVKIDELIIKAHDTTAVIGRNGAGKTSLLRAIGLLVPAEFLHYSLAGENMQYGKQTLELRRQIAHVFQTPKLLSGSVLYNVALPLRLRGEKRETAEKEALRWLDVVQAGHLADRNPHTLSGGETARVGLARAFVVRPKLILMDEPFSALDVESKMHVLRNMREWLRLAQTTAILVSHDYAEVSYLADRLIVMDKGKIVADGKPGDVLDRGDITFVRDFAALGGRELGGHGKNCTTDRR